jgi:TonB family protein
MSLRRSPVAIAISASVHVCAFAAIVWMSSLAPVRVPRTGTPSSLIYNVFIPPPVRPVVLDRQVTPVKLPPPAPKVAPPEELPKVAVAAPPPLPEVHRAEPLPPPKETSPSEPAPRPDPPKAPTPRPLVVGTFEQTTTTTARNVEPTREVQTTGFDTAQSRTPEAKVAATSVGAFDTTAAAGSPPPGNQRPARAVASTGFNSDAPAGQAQRPNGTVVRDPGFDAAPAPQHAALRRQEPIDVPVEVLFKPTPSYSTEARALKIEGEVALEVEFLATTKIRVVRVVRGLGHGLDEAAVQAAEQIRFKPAQSGGRPVDVRTTLHIVFKLA